MVVQALEISRKTTMVGAPAIREIINITFDWVTFPNKRS